MKVLSFTLTARVVKVKATDANYAGRCNPLEKILPYYLLARNKHFMLLSSKHKQSIYKISLNLLVQGRIKESGAETTNFNLHPKKGKLSRGDGF